MVWSRRDFFYKQRFFSPLFLKAMTSQHYDWSVAMSSLNQHYYDDKGTTQTREYVTHCVCSLFIFLHVSSCHTCWHLIINRTTEGPDGASTLRHIVERPCSGDHAFLRLLSLYLFVAISSPVSHLPLVKRLIWRTAGSLLKTWKLLTEEKKDIHPPLTTQSSPTTQEKTASTWSW